MAIVLTSVMAINFVGYGVVNNSKVFAHEVSRKKIKDVTLKLWVSTDEQKLVREMCDEFIEKNKNKVNLNIKIGAQSEQDCDKAVLADIDNAADVFSFADNQKKILVKSGALLEVPKKKYKDVLKRNTSGSIEAASMNNKLYAFPRTADNGYFLYYNKKYITDEDAKSMEKIVEKAAKADKKVALELGSGWYQWGFFRAAGFNTSVDDNGNTQCNWNGQIGKYKGTDVVEAIINLVNYQSIINTDDDSFESGIKDGTIVAGVRGTWSATKVENAWGEDYAATKLPTFNVAGDDLQLYSVAGCKLFGVNSKTKNKVWSLKLANWLSNEENQVRFCVEKGMGPSNLNAAKTEVVQNNPALAAVAMQQQWSEIQNVGERFWLPTLKLGTVLLSGNKENIDLQEFLDEMVKKIETPLNNSNNTKQETK